jgi:hypothetical protein
MNFDQAKQDVIDWIVSFVEKPNPLLNNWPPCPYARQARLSNRLQILQGLHPYYDLKRHSNWGMQNYDVVAYIYDPKEFDPIQFQDFVSSAQTAYLNHKDLIALEDHPGLPEKVLGVIMNQGTYALVFLQSKSKLNEAAQQLSEKGYYKDWPEDYLQGLFSHRQDPR